jgi:hypothetical protein
VHTATILQFVVITHNPKSRESKDLIEFVVSEIEPKKHLSPD